MKTTKNVSPLIEAIVEEFDFSKSIIFSILDDFDFSKENAVDQLLSLFEKDEEAAMDYFSDLYTNRLSLKKKVQEIKAAQAREFNQEMLNDFLTLPELKGTRVALGIN